MAAYIQRFFEMAPYIETSVKNAQLQLAKQSKPAIETSAIEWLAGKRLPEIYAETFKQRFTRTAETPTSKASDGILLSSQL